MTRTLEELYRILDNVQKHRECRLGKLDDDFYASGLVSFTDIWSVQVARRIVADRRKQHRGYGEGQA